jgi:hypothetical protein
VIPSEEKWWKGSQQRLQAEITAIPLGLGLYRDIAQNSFLFTTPAIPVQQYQSPTFPSAQPVVIAWCPLLIPSLCTAGWPGRIMQAFPGDVIAGLNAGTRAMVLISWIRQGTRYQQICDASQGQLAIGNADSVQLGYFCEVPSTDPAAIAALIRLAITVSPGGQGRTSSARLSTSNQDLSVGGPQLVTLGLFNWTRARNWTWHIALIGVAPGTSVPSITFLDALAVPISTYAPLAITPSATVQGIAWGLVPNRAEWPPGAASAEIRCDDAIGFSSLSAELGGEA